MRSTGRFRRFDDRFQKCGTEVGSQSDHFLRALMPALAEIFQGRGTRGKFATSFSLSQAVMGQWCSENKTNKLIPCSSSCPATAPDTTPHQSKLLEKHQHSREERVAYAPGRPELCIVCIRPKEIPLLRSFVLSLMGQFHFLVDDVQLLYVGSYHFSCAPLKRQR